MLQNWTKLLPYFIVKRLTLKIIPDVIKIENQDFYIYTTHKNEYLLLKK